MARYPRPKRGDLVPSLTSVEVLFLQQLPVNSLAQGMQGADFFTLANDMGKKEMEEKDKLQYVARMIHGLKAKGVQIIVYDTCWCYLSSRDSLRLLEAIDPDDQNSHSYSGRGLGGGRRCTSNPGSRIRDYHGYTARDDI